MRPLRDSTMYNAVTGQRRDRLAAPLVMATALAEGLNVYDAFLEAGYSVAEATLYSEEHNTGPSCDRCHDQGQFLDTGAFCECETGQALKAASLAASLRDSKIPAGYAQLTLDTWLERLNEHQKKGKWLGYSAALLFLRSPGHRFRLGECYEAIGVPFPADVTSDEPKNSIVFYGPLGTGKTGLMSSIANELLTKEQLIYLRLGDLFERIQSTYKDKNKSSGAMIRKYAKSPLLLLDEMTWETPSDDKRRIMESIMRPRCAEQLPFVATTNQTPEQFEQHWKGRIAEVVLESAHWIPVEGVNLRQKARSLRAI